MVVSNIKCTAYVLQRHQSRQTQNIQQQQKHDTYTNNIDDIMMLNEQRLRTFYENSNVYYIFNIEQKQRKNAIETSILVSLARFG